MLEFPFILLTLPTGNTEAVETKLSSVKVSKYIYKTKRGGEKKKGFEKWQYLILFHVVDNSWKGLRCEWTTTLTQ